MCTEHLLHAPKAQLLERCLLLCHLAKFELAMSTSLFAVFAVSDVPGNKAGFARATQDEDRVRMLADLLLCSQQCVLRMARTCPQILTMNPNEVTQRLMLLKVSPCAPVIKLYLCKRGGPTLFTCLTSLMGEMVGVMTQRSNGTET